ncbi:MAG: HAD family hydrolase [Gemmataceae bacterium]
MPLTLEQYADYLDTRSDLFWPAPPECEPPKAKPHLVRLPQVRIVLWNVYGTLLRISLGELVLEHPQEFVMSTALEKTAQEFRMWPAMTRRPGLPGEYLRLMYKNALAELQFQPGNQERYPEILADKIWTQIVKKLMHNEYTFDVEFYGSLDEYCRKIAYFFHQSLQAVGPYSGMDRALTYVHDHLDGQGLLADGQCFSVVQLAREFRRLDPNRSLEEVCPRMWHFWSWEQRARKPSERLFREAVRRLQANGYEPWHVLHVGSSIERDVLPARKLGMHTALFAGDKTSLRATKEQLKDRASRPDVLLTELNQIEEVVG